MSSACTGPVGLPVQRITSRTSTPPGPYRFAPPPRFGEGDGGEVEACGPRTSPPNPPPRSGEGGTRRGRRPPALRSPPPPFTHPLRPHRNLIRTGEICRHRLGHLPRGRPFDAARERRPEPDALHRRLGVAKGRVEHPALLVVDHHEHRLLLAAAARLRVGVG